jgi:hypothetical protein
LAKLSLIDFVTFLAVGSRTDIRAKRSIGQVGLMLLKNSRARPNRPGYQNFFLLKRALTNNVCNSVRRKNDIPNYGADFRVAEFFNSIRPSCQ